MTALLYIFGYLVGVIMFARLWYALYPWKEHGWGDYKWWGERVSKSNLRQISTFLGMLWPVLAPACFVWLFFFKVPWLGTRDDRAALRKVKREKAELQMREREARVAEMERSLGITR